MRTIAGSTLLADMLSSSHVIYRMFMHATMLTECFTDMQQVCTVLPTALPVLLDVHRAYVRVHAQCVYARYLHSAPVGR